MAIENLALTPTVDANTYFAVNQANQDYRAQASALATYISSIMSSVDNKVTFYASPSATGFTVTLTNSSASQYLLLTPVGAYATGTIVLPALASCVDKQEILCFCSQAVTTLTINGNGSTVTGAPTTLAANAFFRLRYDIISHVWYRVG